MAGLGARAVGPSPSLLPKGALAPTSATPAPHRARSLDARDGHKGRDARDRAAEDERVHVVRALVRVDGLEVDEVALAPLPLPSVTPASFSTAKICPTRPLTWDAGSP